MKKGRGMPGLRIILKSNLRGNSDFTDGCQIDPPTVAVEVNDAMTHGEQGVVLGSLDVLAGVPFRTALADQNAAGLRGFARVQLDAATFRRRIAAVPNGPLTFFMCHVARSRRPAGRHQKIAEQRR